MPVLSWSYAAILAMCILEQTAKLGELYLRDRACPTQLILLRTFVNAYHSSLKLQEQMGNNRIRFAQRLNEMSDELLGLAREGEKLRKLASSHASLGSSE